MYKLKIIFIFFVLMIFALPAIGKNFKIKSISDDGQTVLLKNKKTTMEWELRKGESIDGWTIIEINKNRVVLEKEPEDEMQMIFEQIELSVPHSRSIKSTTNGE